MCVTNHQETKFNLMYIYSYRIIALGSWTNIILPLWRCDYESVDQESQTQTDFCFHESSYPVEGTKFLVAHLLW